MKICRVFEIFNHFWKVKKFAADDIISCIQPDKLSSVYRGAKRFTFWLSKQFIRLIYKLSQNDHTYSQKIKQINLQYLIIVLNRAADSMLLASWKTWTFIFSDTDSILKKLTLWAVTAINAHIFANKSCLFTSQRTARTTLVVNL